MLGERIPALSSSVDLGPPRLIVVVDTEEAFDWTKSHSRSETDVTHIGEQRHAQRIYESYRVRPTYVVDYPVATQEFGYRPLREWLDDDKCEIGSHLHPWVNPPFDEELTVRNTYPGNLPAPLEREKLARLTGAIAEHFQRQPTVYKAGRYGIGSATSSVLEELGYRVDLSVVPHTDFAADGGPDFCGIDVDPFWFGASRTLLEIPLTVGWCGMLRRYGEVLQPFLMTQARERLHLPGVFARLGLFERIRLTPEGIAFAEMKRLTETLLAAGKRLFCLTYHSPSLVAGQTPYVRNDADRDRFLRSIEQYCEYFFAGCGGVACTPSELWDMLRGGQTERPRPAAPRTEVTARQSAAP
jgi:hypothetical protein